MEPTWGQVRRALREGRDTEVCGEDHGHTGLGRATEINELVSPRGAAGQKGSLTRPGFERRMT